MNAEPVETTSDERVMAALAHFFGLFAALIVWATQKDKSRFLRFQSLQAIAFDGVFMVVYMLFMFCMMGGVMLIILAGVWATMQSSAADVGFPGMIVGLIVPWLMMMCVMPVALAAVLVRVIAAVSVAGGHNFRYPWLGARVEAFLGAP